MPGQMALWVSTTAFRVGAVINPILLLRKLNSGAVKWVKVIQLKSGLWVPKALSIGCIISKGRSRTEEDLCSELWKLEWHGADTWASLDCYVVN